MRLLGVVLILSGIFSFPFPLVRVALGEPIPPLSLQIDAAQPLGSTETLQRLLDGVGSEFAPPQELAGKLRALGIKRLRLINVDSGNTEIVQGKLVAPLLDQQLQWCRLVGAAPHIIIGQGFPKWLSTHGNDPNYGPKDWPAYKKYLELVFSHVIFEQNFPHATWEVANEPDIKGAPVSQYPRPAQLATEEDYQAYLKLYRSIAEVAQQLEQSHPGLRIFLGGPAGTSYSFSKGNFNWYERFLLDISTGGLKIDFLSFHYYGNLSALGDRPNLTIYPPFEKHVANLRGWIRQYRPGLPIWITEWGPSYLTEMTPAGLINGNYVGAAWSAAFIEAMHRCQVEGAIFLVTNDLHENWAWPALFHGQNPKPIYWVFEMFRQLQGQLLQLKGGSAAVGALAARQDNRLAAVLWNYNWQWPETGPGQEGAQAERLNIKFSGLPDGNYRLTLRQLSEKSGNPPLPAGSSQPSVATPLNHDLGGHVANRGALDLEIALPPSSVVLLEMAPGPTPGGGMIAN